MVINKMTKTPLPAAERELLDSIVDGRAALLLGQRHTTGLMDELVQDIAALSHTDPKSNLSAQLHDLGSASRLEGVRQAFTRQVASENLLSIASCPWSIVLTSAIDPTVFEAFARVGGRAGQRLRVLYPQQAGSLTVSANPSSLSIVRLFGSFDEQTVDFQPPLNSPALRRRQMFDVGPVLQQLPFLTARGCLVVDGIGSDDWLPLDLLALACTSMPPGSLHWFRGHENPVDLQALEDFGDCLISHDGTLAEFISRVIAGSEMHRLRAAQDSVASVDDHAISHGRAGRRKQIVLTPQEWRSAAQAAVILDDKATAPPLPLRQDQEWAEFRRFLRGLHRPPDWSGVVRGFLFERNVAVDLVTRVEEALFNLGSVNPVATAADPAVNYSRRPILLTGPPACGKSRLMHWLAVQLRQRGHVVVYATPSAGRFKPEGLERVCRLLEERGASGVALLVDDLDNSTYSQLSEMLAAVGRNVVVVGTARTAPSSEDPDLDPRRAPMRQGDYVPFPVPARLTVEEAGRFRNYLQRFGYTLTGFTDSQLRDRYFLLLLYFMLPDTQGNVRLRVADAYDRLARALDMAARTAQPNTQPGTEFSAQLLRTASELFPGIEFKLPGTETPNSPFEHLETTQQAIDLCLLCARVKRPIPVDLLLRTFGSDFIRYYPVFSHSLGESELLQELVDEHGSVVLDTGHSELARLALLGVRPTKVDQLKLLRLVINGIRWNEDAYPGEDLNQDFCVDLLQVFGPRGEYSTEYSSPTSLNEIAALLTHIRVDLNVRISKLLLLEAQAWRLQMDSAEYDSALDFASHAITVLEQAEEILLSRRATDTRNNELNNVLTARASVHGFIIGAHLRRLAELRKNGSSDEAIQRIRDLIDQELPLVSLYVGRTQAFGRASFYPFDIDFWTLRDIFERMPYITEAERVRLLSRMASVLDAASEEPIEAHQVTHFRRRRIQLAEFEGRHTVSAEIAEEMRQNGDFSGYCQLIRGQTYDSTNRTALSPSIAGNGLRTLLDLGGGVWRDREAMALAHHLWMDAHIPEGRVGGEEPVRIGCSREEWKEWSRILQARQIFPEDEDNALIRFCLAWAQFQLDEAREGLAQIAALETSSTGSRRRIGCLAVLTNEEGHPRPYQAIARRRQGQTWVCYAPQLLTEIRVPPDIVAVHTDMVVGSEISIMMGLNYRGLLPWAERNTEARPEGRRGQPDRARPGRRPSPALMPRRRL